METIGFIGLGKMGFPMARNLLRAGYELRVFDLRREVAQALAEEGGGRVQVCSTSAQAVAAANLVVSMVPDDQALREIALGEQGVLQQLAEGGLHLSLSTVSPHTTSRLVEVYAGRGRTFLGANVIGRPELAEQRRLALLLSGPRAAKERARLLCLALGENIYDFGEDPLAANIAKLLINFRLAITLAALSESLALGERLGLDPTLLADMMRATQFGGVAEETYGPMIASRTYEPNRFSLELGLKDLSLLSHVAEGVSVPMPLLAVVMGRVQTCLANGWEGDWSSLDRATRQAAGLIGEAERQVEKMALR